MNRIVTMTLAALLLGGLGCGDDTVKPGSMVVNWKHGELSTLTCGSRNIANIEARLIRGEDVAKMNSACAADDKAGAFTFEELTPGNYIVEVEGFNGDTPPKGTYLGVLPRVGVKEGKETTTDPITLNEKPARIRVDWRVPEGKCGSSDIKTVKVQILFDGDTQPDLQAEQTGDCDATYVDPDDLSGKELLAGMLFEDLGQNEKVVILVQGMDGSKNVISKVERTAFELDEGDDIDIVVDLDYCPGTPPTCS